MISIPNTATDPPPRPTAPSIGIDKERVDPYTLQVLEQLFPGHHGVDFLARLLRQAIVKQMALPELDCPEVADVAVITVQNLRKLSRLMGIAYDTTEKYVVVLNQLRFLHKKRSRRQIVLHFPLRRCQLAEPESLDTLDYRPKVTSFADQVKRRMLLWRRNIKLQLTVSSPAPAQADPHALAEALVEDIRTVLREHVDSETESRLLLHIEPLVRSRCTQTHRRLSPQKDDSFADEEVLQGNKSSFSDQKGDFVEGASDQERRLFFQKGDSFADEQTLLRKKATFSDGKGDFVEGTSNQESLLLFQKGDSLGTEGTALVKKATFSDGKDDSLAEASRQERRLFPQKGDFLGGDGKPLSKESAFSDGKDDFLRDERALLRKKATFSGAKDDFEGPARGASLNDNVITPIDSQKEGVGSDNDTSASTGNQGLDRYTPKEAASVGRQLAMFLEKTPKNTGGFVVKCKHCTRTVIRASVIDVLVHAAFPQVDPADERGRPKNWPSWFHDACKKYAGGSPIPAFVRKWLGTDLSWNEIAQQLSEAEASYKRYMIDGGTADLVRRFLRGEMEQQVLDAQLQGITPSGGKPSAVSPQAPLVAAVSRAGGEKMVVASVSPSLVMAEEKTWMDEYEAEALAEEILRDGRGLGVSKAVVKAEHGVCVVLVTGQGLRFTMKTPQHWRTHLATVRPLLEEQRMQRRQGTDIQQEKRGE